MNLPWDQEAGKALRAAQAVLAPADVAWFEAAHAPAFIDPAAAMERIFGQLLGGDAGPAANADIEPEAAAPMRRHEPRVGAHAPTEPAARPAPSSAPAPRIARDPHARPLISVRPLRPVARDGRSPVHARDAGGTAGRPPTKPGAVPDAWPDPMAQAGASIPDERGARRRDSSSVEDRPASNGIRRAVVATDMTADQNAFRAARAGDDRHPIAHDTHAAEPGLSHPRYAAARSTRLVTGLSELNNLFRSVIDSQSDDRLAPETARSTAQDESEVARATAPDAYAGETARPAGQHEVIPPNAPARWSASRTDHAPESSFAAPGIDHAHETSSAVPSIHTGRQSGLRAGTLASGHAAIDTPIASFAGAASTLADPTREDVLLDRLLDRFEERLREQAIRHLGFTGGLT